MAGAELCRLIDPLDDQGVALDELALDGWQCVSERIGAKNAQREFRVGITEYRWRPILLLRGLSEALLPRSGAL